MSRAPMTVGDLNSRRRLTPTEWAEGAGAPQLKQRRPMPVGPGGLPVPDAKAVYRKEIDGLLLKNIARKAYLASADVRIPAAEKQLVGLALHRLALERFPAVDMAVLERYELAGLREKLAVDFKAVCYEKPMVFDLPEPMLAPGPINFHADLGGRDGSGPALPESLTPFFARVLAVRRDQKRFNDLIGFPGQFRLAEGRWPRWFEIERQVPEVASWLAEQRSAST